MDTIFALATAKGRAGVSVIRISGPQSHQAVKRLSATLPEPRRAALRQLKWQGDLIDRALILIFNVGESFTGEESAELHLHGSVAIVSKITQILSGINGLRIAEPGEFTRRALENGKLDLTQVEGLSDLIDAETEAQRKQAIQIMDGALGRKAESWRLDLIRAVSLVEAAIDFAEEDIPDDIWTEVSARISILLIDLESELAGTAAAERIRQGFEVAIIGSPNAGKSTLLNALARRDAAITSEIAGTTRDVIEVRMDLSGFAVTLLDTAGLRETIDPVERIGVDRALRRAQLADIRIFLLSHPDEVLMLESGNDDILILGKDDLHGTGLGISGKTGFGLDRLIQEISAKLAKRVAGAGLSVRHRHRVAIERAVVSLKGASSLISSGNCEAELVALEFHSGIRALESLIGRVDVEVLLGEIFSSFCVGK